ncbi:tRNA pseudouridine(55) synthase [hydrothermal vent metagenome]|uniref:tRNA pseudouridine(55) synthase n=1 Tax=hydrothermal vent metagenome TaxID=652676 RepID=A0A3B1DJ10_9ZZZZ
MDKQGILLIDKPSGITSHDVVDVVRKKFQMKRIGHAGTLDPLATGLLIILVGKSTKLFDKFVGFDKAYRATLILGTATDSADTEGKIIEKCSFTHVTQEQVFEVFKKFIGVIEQVPPMVSAVKHKGKKLYELARKGITVERKARTITIERLEIKRFKSPEVEFILECSKGTYVRQIAEDVGKVLGCGACISQIERTKVGVFTLEEAIKLEEINESHLRNWQG